MFENFRSPPTQRTTRHSFRKQSDSGDQSILSQSDTTKSSSFADEDLHSNERPANSVENSTPSDEKDQGAIRRRSFKKGWFSIDCWLKKSKLTLQSLSIENQIKYS